MCSIYVYSPYIGKEGIYKYEFRTENFSFCTSVINSNVRISIFLDINNAHVLNIDTILSFVDVTISDKSNMKPYIISKRININDINIITDHYINDTGGSTEYETSNHTDYISIPTNVECMVFINSLTCPSCVHFYTSNNEASSCGQYGTFAVNGVIDPPGFIFRIPKGAKYCRFTSTFSGSFTGDIIFLSKYMLPLVNIPRGDLTIFKEGYILDDGTIQTGLYNGQYTWYYEMNIPDGLRSLKNYSKLLYIACYDSDGNYLGKSSGYKGIDPIGNQGWRIYNLPENTYTLKIPFFYNTENDISTATAIVANYIIAPMFPSTNSDRLYNIAPEQQVLYEFCPGNIADNEYEGDTLIADSTIHFLTPVNCNLQDNSSNTLDLQDNINIYNDTSVLILPSTYTSTGEPTRLVIFCHGAGGSVTINDSQIERYTAAQYLVANGYAVMDTNGIPLDYANEQGIDSLNNVGSWLAIQCYVKAYHYVINNYNIKKDGVFVCGASMGGISSTNLVMSGQIPVIAHGAFCPVLDTYNEIWLHPWSSGAPKTALAKLFNFDIDNGSYTYSEKKVCGFNPVNNHTVTINNQKYTNYPCPVKFWHCDNDTIVSATVTQNFIQQIKNAGGQAYLRSFPTGGHAPDTTGNPISNPSGNTSYRGTTLTIYSAMEELLIWFNRYN